MVASSPKVRDVQLDWNDPVRTLKVDLDQDKARALGLAPADVAFVTQTVMNGATLSQLREHEDLIDIVARAVPSERLDLDTLKDVNLFTRQGTVVPLSQVARVRYELEEPVLWRRNRDMAITVRADVKDGEQGVSVTQEIRPLLKDIEAKLPFGYRIDVGGAVEESDKANRALTAVFPVMLVTILTILMLQLQSFSKMFMVFLTAPLGLIGVVAALLMFQAPLGFVAILGITALVRDDHAQLGDPDRPGAGGDGRRPRPLERGRRSGRPPDPSGGADRRGHRAGDDSADAQRVLGPDGDRHHGRPHGRDGADDLLRAGALRGLVQGGASAAPRRQVSRQPIRCSPHDCAVRFEVMTLP